MDQMLPSMDRMDIDGWGTRLVETPTDRWGVSPPIGGSIHGSNVLLMEIYAFHGWGVFTD